MPDTILEEIISLRKRIEDIKKKVRNKKRELNKLQEENATLEKSFDSDITIIPVNLKKELKAKREKINTIKQEIFEIKKILWGTVSEGGGLIWKHDRLYDEYKKLIIDEDELFYELKDKSINRYTDKIQKKIKDALKRNQIKIDEEEMLELTLEVLSNKISDEDDWYDEIPGEEVEKENYTQAIRDVLKDRYNIIDVEGKNEKWDLRNEFDRIIDEFTKADTMEEKVYNEIELWEKFAEEPPDNFWIGEKSEIALEMLKTYIADLKKATVTGYFKGKKIDYEAAERLNQYLINVLEKIRDKDILEDEEEVIS